MVMKASPTKLKDKGFLLIATTTIIVTMFASFLISHKLTIHRAMVVNSFLCKDKKKYSIESLKQFTYDELRRIDSAINSGEYKNATEFVTKCESEKIWLSTDKNRVTDNGYYISRMFYSGNKVKRSCFYKKKNGSDRSFKELITRELYRDSKYPQHIYVELTKEYFIEGIDKKIVTKALIKLDYATKNRNATNPQKEILKEFETNLEDI